MPTPNPPVVAEIEYATRGDANARPHLSEARILRLLCVALALIVLFPCLLAAIVLSVLLATR